MLKNRNVNDSILYLFIIPIIQVLVALFIYDFVNDQYPLGRRDIGWGIYINLTTKIYLVLVLINAIILRHLKKTIVEVALVILTVSIFDFWLLGALETRPNRIKFILGLTNGLLLLAPIVKIIVSKKRLNVIEDENLLDENGTQHSS